MNLTLNLALWIAAGLLAAVLLVSTAKLFVPKEKMASVGHAAEWVLDFSPGALRAIGTLELLAAAGLILPAVLDIAPILVPVTATCVALLFVGAATMRFRRGEKATIVPDLVYLALAAFVAWGRFGPESFAG
jgi:DoxX-like family